MHRRFGSCYRALLVSTACCNANGNSHFSGPILQYRYQCQSQSKSQYRSSKLQCILQCRYAIAVEELTGTGTFALQYFVPCLLGSLLPAERRLSPILYLLPVQRTTTWKCFCSVSYSTVQLVSILPLYEHKRLLFVEKMPFIKNNKGSSFMSCIWGKYINDVTLFLFIWTATKQPVYFVWPNLPWTMHWQKKRYRGGLIDD